MELPAYTTIDIDSAHWKFVQRHWDWRISMLVYTHGKGETLIPEIPRSYHGSWRCRPGHLRTLPDEEYAACGGGKRGATRGAKTTQEEEVDDEEEEWAGGGGISVDASTQEKFYGNINLYQGQSLVALGTRSGEGGHGK
jgi:hypothetical protein